MVIVRLKKRGRGIAATAVAGRITVTYLPFRDGQILLIRLFICAYFINALQALIPTAPFSFDASLLPLALPLLFALHGQDAEATVSGFNQFISFQVAESFIIGSAPCLYCVDLTINALDLRDAHILFHV